MISAVAHRHTRRHDDRMIATARSSVMTRVYVRAVAHRHDVQHFDAGAQARARTRTRATAQYSMPTVATVRYGARRWETQ